MTPPRGARKRRAPPHGPANGRSPPRKAVVRHADSDRCRGSVKPPSQSVDRCRRELALCDTGRIVGRPWGRYTCHRRPEWRNGRRTGFKIPCPLRDVRVRVPPRALTPADERSLASRAIYSPPRQFGSVRPAVRGQDAPNAARDACRPTDCGTPDATSADRRRGSLCH